VSPERIEPEYRLRALERKLDDLRRGRRLAADPERTGVVDLADFGRRCESVADHAAESLLGLLAQEDAASRCVARVAEEIELAARTAALLETLPRSPTRIEQQLALLDEAAQAVAAARASSLELEERPVLAGISALARRERTLFEPLVEFTGRIEEAPAGMVDVAAVRRALRRALLEHALGGVAGPFRLSVSRDGVLEFADREFRSETVSDALARGPNEPPGVRQALDLRAATEDVALQDFLLVKAVDEALAALLAPELSGVAWLNRARELPRKPGKKLALRPEALRRTVAGWNVDEAVRAAERLANRRLGPEWARLPRGAYLLRLFGSEDDALAEDLLALGPALRRMERGEAPGEPDAVRERARRALSALLGMLG